MNSQIGLRNSQLEVHVAIISREKQSTAATKDMGILPSIDYSIVYLGGLITLLHVLYLLFL